MQGRASWRPAARERVFVAIGDRWRSLSVRGRSGLRLGAWGGSRTYRGAGGEAKVGVQARESGMGWVVRHG